MAAWPPIVRLGVVILAGLMMFPLLESFSPLAVFGFAVGACLFVFADKLHKPDDSADLGDGGRRSP